MGPTEGQPQDDDLSEDGPGFEELRQDRRGQKGEEETDVSVQQRCDEENGDREEAVSSLSRNWTWLTLLCKTDSPSAVHSEFQSRHVL